MTKYPFHLLRLPASPGTIWIRLGIALLLGAVNVCSFAPIGWGYLPWLLLPAYAILLWGASYRLALGVGFAFGMGYYGVGISWVWYSLHDVGGIPSLVAACLVMLLAAWMSLFSALNAFLWNICFSSIRVARLNMGIFPLVAGASWVCTEWLRGTVLGGFPWLALGYSQTDTLLSGYAPVFGVYGIGGLLVCGALSLGGIVYNGMQSSGLLAGEKNPKTSNGVLPFLWIWVAIILIGGIGLRQIAWSDPIGANYRVHLLQGGIPQSLKFIPEQFGRTLSLYRGLIETHPSADIIILPETALPRLIDAIPREYQHFLLSWVAEHDGLLLTGIPRLEQQGQERGYYNSALGIYPGGIYQYDKIHLTPFGEYIPGFLVRWLNGWQIPLGSLQSGSVSQEIWDTGKLRIGVNICYEDLFGEEIIRQLPRAEILVNISNLAWFGDSWAADQHLQIGRVRALETGRMMLRATNTGATAIIAPDGQVLERLPYWTSGVLSGTVRAYQGTTPYVWWGNYPVLIIGFLLLTLVTWRCYRYHLANQGTG